MYHFNSECNMTANTSRYFPLVFFFAHSFVLYINPKNVYKYTIHFLRCVKFNKWDYILWHSHIETFFLYASCHHFFICSGFFGGAFICVSLFSFDLINKLTSLLFTVLFKNYIWKKRLRIYDGVYLMIN